MFRNFTQPRPLRIFNYGESPSEKTIASLIYMMNIDNDDGFYEILETLPHFYLKLFPFYEVISENGDNILHWAARCPSKRKNQLVKFILNSGNLLTACIKMKNKEGFLAYEYAAQNQNKYLCEILCTKKH